MTPERVEVAVIGGGPAGALTAALLAGLGHEVVLLERAPRWRWRACGVFSAPAAVAALRRVGVADDAIARVAQPLAAMRVESRGDATFRLTYDGTGSVADSAVGFDREALDGELLDRARAAGAAVRLGARVDGVILDHGGSRLQVSHADAGPGTELAASVVVGADGLRSVVARATGVARRPPFATRTALTCHVSSTRLSPALAGASPDARMVVLRDGYVGLAPVPGGRVNVGIVLGPSWSGRLRADGGARVSADVVAAVAGGVRAEASLEPLDHVAGIRPVSASVARRAGPGWLLVGDAAGFLDPFTGEGLHRAILSAELGAGVAHDVLRSRAGARLATYDAAMRARFRTKDIVSRLVLAFLARPALFEYVARRLGRRGATRERMGRVIGDLEPASRALDPRFLAALLAP